MSDKVLKTLLILAKKDDTDAINQLIDMFKPLMYKNSIIDGTFNEDCYQELNVKLINCIKNFTFDNKRNIFDYLNI